MAGGALWSAGIAQASATELVEAARQLDQLHSLVVLRDGSEVVAHHQAGPGLDRVANVKSVSKTLLSLLVGIGIDRGVLPGVEAHVLPLLGRPATGDARDSLTIGHLLSLQGGLASTSGPNYGAWVSSSDWVSAALDRPLQGNPGERFIYSTGSTHILGAALARAADTSLLDLARRWLGRPLGIDFAP